MARVMPGVTCHGVTALLQAGHAAGFCLKFRQGLDIFFLFFFFSLLLALLGRMHSCCFGASCTLCKPDASCRRLSGVAAPGQLVPWLICAGEGRFGKAKALLQPSALPMAAPVSPPRPHRTRISAASPKPPPGGTCPSLMQLCSRCLEGKMLSEKESTRNS